MKYIQLINSREITVQSIRPNKVIFYLIVILLLSGCSNSTVYKPNPISITPTTTIAKVLVAQYNQWKGTPYKLGGNSRSGIDCSAFVQKTYSQRFGLYLPRTTSAQIQSGKRVYRNNLQAGDLIFFKTSGNRVLHVGIYVEQNIFLHASTSQGVILSSLKNRYWHRHYWIAIRPRGI